MKWSNLFHQALKWYSRKNMSETIICNHVALINPEEKWINESAQRDLLGYNTLSV